MKPDRICSTMADFTGVKWRWELRSPILESSWPRCVVLRRVWDWGTTFDRKETRPFVRLIQAICTGAAQELRIPPSIISSSSNTVRANYHMFGLTTRWACWPAMTGSLTAKLHGLSGTEAPGQSSGRTRPSKFRGDCEEPFLLF